MAVTDPITGDKPSLWIKAIVYRLISSVGFNYTDSALYLLNNAIIIVLNYKQTRIVASLPYILACCNFIGLLGIISIGDGMMG